MGIIATLNKLGAEGWEVVSVIHEADPSEEFFLKRPK